MAMTAALLPIPATLSPASAEPEEEGSAAPLVVDRITPDSPGEDSTLRVAGEVTNTTGETVEDVTVRMRYSRHPFTSRDELDKFATGEDWQPNASGPDEEFDGELAPAAVAQLRAHVAGCDVCERFGVVGAKRRRLEVRRDAALDQPHPLRVRDRGRGHVEAHEAGDTRVGPARIVVAVEAAKLVRAQRGYLVARITPPQHRERQGEPMERRIDSVRGADVQHTRLARRISARARFKQLTNDWCRDVRDHVVERT